MITACYNINDVKLLYIGAKDHTEGFCIQFLSEMQLQYNILYKTNVTVVKFHVNKRFFTKYRILCD